MADVAPPTLPAMPQPIKAWPHLSNRQRLVMAAVPLFSFLIIWFWLRVVWPPPPKKVKTDANENGHATESTPLSSSYNKAGSTEIQVREEGDVAGNYDDDWTTTFDFVFLVVMVIALGILCGATYLFQPDLYDRSDFWISQLPKLAVMMGVSLTGGAICRRFCAVDSNGYIITNKDSWFKVNYTRKLQHFAAYAVPLVVHSPVHGPLALAWGDWFTMLAFLVLIKPLRERSSFLMLQFNSLDRPEDRPNTLKWIIAGNIFPGLLFIIFFRYLYSFHGQQDLAFIFIMITGIGDGLAEPVGITWGRHKYLTSSLMGGPKYQRSLEGSACVFLSAMIFCSTFWYAFSNEEEYWVALIILAPLMTWAEAISPHTMDTPFLMGLGGTVLFLVTNLKVKVLWV
eukprot:gb/GEZN01006160.1/.p1 GENE.gb/GEZN01006160.1/~~gb/GEZN01006160.1/.p1  ORF type:complete len:398 (+),score=43.53 gb/GEZN01006160.1/:88-1281(+)